MDASKHNSESASRKFLCVYEQCDEEFYRALRKHLIVWQRAGYIQWLETAGGDPIAWTMQAHIKNADLILLLISSDFFSNDHCYETMEAALQEKMRRQVPVVPILARNSPWKESACGDLKALPDNECPIAQWKYAEQAYENIYNSLAGFVPGLFALRTTSPDRPRSFQLRDLPNDYVLRPNVFQDIKHKLLEQGNGHTTALRGAGGFGKTTLALALCHDREIQAAFPDGIRWIESGEHPPGELDLLNTLLASLETLYDEAPTLEKARDRWRTVLRDRRCLLVIDDVWQAKALAPLLAGGPRCVRLITTRNDQVLPNEAVRIIVDAMDREDAIAMFCAGLPEEIRLPVHRPRLKALVERLNYWPLLLTLARGLLRSQGGYRRDMGLALQRLEQAYETRGVLAFDLSNEQEREHAAGACLKTSLRHLEEFTSARYHAMERYLELAVFPEDTDISLVTLQHFWKGTGNLEPWETEDLCIHLHKLSLLLICDPDAGTIRLHDVMRNYLMQSVGSQTLRALHGRFLDACQQTLRLKRWADLPADDHYLWQHLISHLCQAGCRDALQATLTDLLYLIRKALYAGISALEEDLSRSITFFSAEAPELAPSFDSLQKSIVRLSHLLRQVQTSAEIGGLLLSHLGWEPAFAEQRLSLERELQRPFLTAWYPLPQRSCSALLRTLHGHIDGVRGCTVSPDGRFIVSVSSDKTLKVWDVATGEMQHSLTGHTDRVASCVVSLDNRFIVSASHDKTLKMWDVATGKERFSFIGHTDGITGCAISLDGRFIVSSSYDKTLKVWDVATGEEHYTLTGHTGGVTDCAISSDGHFIVSASDDHTLKMWDMTTGEECYTLIGHTASVTGCVVSLDGRFIVSASHDRTLKVWDVATREERFPSLAGHTNWVTDCAVSPDGRYIVSASYDKTLKVWNADTGKEHYTLMGHIDWVSGCAVSPDGRYIVSASYDKTLKVWNAATREECFSLSNHINVGTCYCSVSLDGHFIVSASDDHTLEVWDTATGAKRCTLIGHTDSVTCCAISPNSRFIVSTSWDKTLRVWDATTGEERFSLAGHTYWVTGCAVSRDSRFIVSISGDKTLKVWDATTGKERYTLTGHTASVTSCVMSPDGRFIVSASDDHTLKVWNTATGEKRYTLTGHTASITSCVMSPDGHFIVSASGDKSLKVWDAATGVERYTLMGHNHWITSCAVSPDSRYIVSTSEDHTLRVWNAATGKERSILTGHTDRVTGCAVSPDGRYIVSVSWDKTLKVWNAATGQRLLTFPVDGVLSGCAFHPDGAHLVACGGQGVFFLRLVVSL